MKFFNFFIISNKSKLVEELLENWYEETTKMESGFFDYYDKTKTTSECNNLKEVTEGKVAETVSCRKVQVISGTSGVGLLSNYIGKVYRWAAAIVGMVAVVVIIISGIQIATAGGDTGKIDEAKKRIFQSLAGVAILFLSALILYTINPNFFTGG